MKLEPRQKLSVALAAFFPFTCISGGFIGVGGFSSVLVLLGLVVMLVIPAALLVSVLVVVLSVKFRKICYPLVVISIAFHIAFYFWSVHIGREMIF